MNKKVIAIIGGVLLVVVCGLLIWNFTSNKTADAVKFEEEYEALNGTKNTAGTNTYQDLDIKKDNKVKYATIEEVIETVDKGTGLIYLGFPNCPWCRGMLPILMDALNCSCIENVLYYNPIDLRDTYEIVDGKAEKTKDASSEYYELMDLLEEYLDDYVLTDEDGKEYATGEKRLYVPMVIAVKNGTIVGTYETVELNDGQTPYDELTKEQKQEYKTNFETMINEVLKENITCDEHC